MNLFGIILMLLCAGFCIVANWRHQAWKYEQAQQERDFWRRVVRRHGKRVEY